MTERQDLGILGRLTRSGRRWDTTGQMRQDAIELVERVISDETKPTGLRLKAVQMLCVFEGQNILDEKISMEIGGAERGAPMMVLLLPENGSEATSPREGTASGLEEDVLDSNHWAEASVEAERTS